MLRDSPCKKRIKITIAGYFITDQLSRHILKRYFKIQSYKCFEMTDAKYFIAKVNSFPSFKQAVSSGKWACTNRHSSPQPVNILSEAFKQGPVIIIFSVSNCHGWHGYARMSSLPEAENVPAQLMSNFTDKSTTCDLKDNTSMQTDNKSYKEDDNVKPGPASQIYHYFNINWLVHFTEFGEQCLTSKKTEELFCIEQPTGMKIGINKSRNWQELDLVCGKQLCEMLDGLYVEMCKLRDEKQLSKSLTKPFFEESSGCTTEKTWEKIVQQVENDLGKVILACPFGSQR